MSPWPNVDVRDYLPDDTQDFLYDLFIGFFQDRIPECSCYSDKSYDEFIHDLSTSLSKYTYELVSSKRVIEAHVTSSVVSSLLRDTTDKIQNMSLDDWAEERKKYIKP